MTLHPKQKHFIDTFVEKFRIQAEAKKACFISVSAAPGSGKTTTLVSACRELSSIIEDSSGYYDTSETKKEVLVLTFNSKNKKDFFKKIKNDKETNEEHYEVSTVNSLFFREIKKIVSKQGVDKSFELDYSKSFFSKNFIEYILKSLVVGEVSLSSKIDKKIDNFRFLNKEIVSENNIELLWSLTNAYYSSISSTKDITRIEKTAEFFGKKRCLHTSLVINPNDIKAISELSGVNSSKCTVEHNLFKIFIARVNQLAKTKERLVFKRQVETKIPLEIMDKDGNSTSAGGTSITKEHTEIEILGNLIKVPHNYYYKTFLNTIKNDSGYMKEVFSRYKAIIIDEAQDNDNILFQIMLKVAMSATVKVFAFVGDPMQSIYAFKSPDHFDILTFVENNKKNIEKHNIEVIEVPLDITYRFGAKISNFLNSLFGTKIESVISGNEFVYPDPLKGDDLLNLVNNISALKGKDGAIICRSNSEATRIYMDLKKRGCSSVSLHSSSRDELREFIKEGSKVIKKDNIRSELYNILNRVFGKKDTYSYLDILSSVEAISFLVNNGYSQLVRYSKEDIEKYISPSARSKKDIVTIGTSHIFKGGEFDYTIIAPDFFKKRGLDTGSIMSEIEQRIEIQDTASDAINVLNQIVNPTELRKSMVTAEVEPSPIEKEENSLSYELNKLENTDEKYIYFVALTRAKEGVFFMDTPYMNELKSCISNTTQIIEENKNLLVHHEENSQKEEMYSSLFVDALSHP